MILDYAALPPSLREQRILADERYITAAVAACYRRVYAPVPADRPPHLERVTMDLRHMCLVTEFSPAWNGTSGAQPDGTIRSQWAGHRREAESG